MNDIYVEIIDPHSEFESSIGIIIYDLDNCGFMIIELIKNKKIVFMNEKQIRIICLDEIFLTVIKGD